MCQMVTLNKGLTKTCQHTIQYIHQGNFCKFITNNLWEKIFGKKYYGQKSVTINLSGENTGIYFVEVFDGEEWICSQINKQ